MLTQGKSEIFKAGDIMWIVLAQCGDDDDDPLQVQKRFHYLVVAARLFHMVFNKIFYHQPSQKVIIEIDDEKDESIRLRCTLPFNVLNSCKLKV